MMMKFHPLADLFPLIEGAEFTELVDDIKANGLRVPIVTIEGETGPVVLDGRNRYRACVEAGVEPRFETYQGDDPAGFVASANLMRRHLSMHDRARLAGEFAKLPHGGDRKSDQGANLRLDAAAPAMTVERAAEVFGVSPRIVDHARKVAQEGSPKLKERFKAGDVAVSAAAGIAKAPIETQEAIDSLPAPAKRKRPQGSRLTAFSPSPLSP